MNRFNSFVRTDYIGLPVDYYQMAVGATEAESGQQLQTQRATIDAARNVEAVYNPDKDLKQSLLSDLDQKIAQLANENLSAPQTMLRLGKVLDDPNLIDGLSGIQGNTNNYRKMQTAMQEYRKANGNDINLARAMDEVEAYNKLDRTGFKNEFMAGYTPDKFMDVVGDIQKVLKDEHADGKTITQIDGRWMIKKGAEFISLDKLLGDAGIQVNDPKYQTQLQHLLYYNARNLGGGDVKKGYDVFYQNKKQDIADLLDNINDHINTLTRSNVKGKNDQAIKDAKDQLKKVQDQEQEFQEMKPDAAFRKSFMGDMAMMAASPYDFYKETNDLNANPYELARYRADLGLRNSLSLYHRKRLDKLHDQQVEEMRNTPVPTITSVSMNDANGKEHNQAVAWLDNKGGYNMENLSQTISALLNSNEQLLKGDGTPISKSKIGYGKRFTASGGIDINTIQEGVKKGTMQLGYLPGTKEFYIASDKGTYRIKSDLGTQRDMDGLYHIFGNESIIDGAPVKTKLSLDGQTLSDVYVTRNTEGETQLYTPLAKEGFDLSKLSSKDFNKITGIEYDSERKWKAGVPGFYVAYDGDQTFNAVGDNNTSGKGVIYGKRFGTVKEYEEDIKSGNFNVKGHTMFYSDGKTITPVENLPAGLAGQDIIGTHMTYMTQPGRGLGHLRNKSSDAKSKSRIKDSETESEGEGGSESEGQTDNE